MGLRDQSWRYPCRGRLTFSHRIRVRRRSFRLWGLPCRLLWRSRRLVRRAAGGRAMLASLGRVVWLLFAMHEAMVPTALGFARQEKRAHGARLQAARVQQGRPPDPPAAPLSALSA